MKQVFRRISELALVPIVLVGCREKPEITQEVRVIKTITVRQRAAEELAQRLREELATFQGEKSQDDDITFVIVKVM